MTDLTPQKIKTLMLIDDSSFDQMIYERIVKKSGVVGRLLQYQDGTKALEYLRDAESPNPDLILLDINMPKMDGFEFLAAATSEFGVELCPIVVMLTTSLNPKDSERANSYEVVRDFLNKPLTTTQLEGLAKMVDEELRHIAT